jgi:hypothetical protein
MRKVATLTLNGVAVRAGGALGLCMSRWLDSERTECLCCVVSAASELGLLYDAICYVKTSTGELEVIHQTSKRLIQALASPLDVDDVNGRAFYYWAEGQGLFGVEHKSGMAQNLATQVPVFAARGLSTTLQHHHPTLSLHSKSSRDQKRQSMILAGWHKREGDTVRALCFSRFGNLYGFGRELYAIKHNDGSIGKVMDLPTAVCACVWEPSFDVEAAIRSPSIVVASTTAHGLSHQQGLKTGVVVVANENEMVLRSVAASCAAKFNLK